MNAYHRNNNGIVSQECLKPLRFQKRAVLYSPSGRLLISQIWSRNILREGFSAALMHDDVYRNLERRTLQASTATKEYDRQRLEIT